MPSFVRGRLPKSELWFSQNPTSLPGSLRQVFIERITSSMNLGSTLTGKDGGAEIPKGSVQKTAWVNVTKSGYVSSGHIKFDQPKPIRVVLKLEPRK